MTHVVTPSANIDHCGDEEKHSPDGRVKGGIRSLGEGHILQYPSCRAMAGEQCEQHEEAPRQHRMYSENRMGRQFQKFEITDAWVPMGTQRVPIRSQCNP